MIFDAKVEVVCDNDDCQYKTNTFVDLSAGARGTYIFNKSSIEKHLQNEGWTIVGDKQFCENDECREIAKTLQEEE